MKWLILACCIVLTCTACHHNADCHRTRQRCRHNGFSLQFADGTCNSTTHQCDCPAGYHHVQFNGIGKRDSGDCGGACMGEHCHCGHGVCHGTCSKRALMYRREKPVCDPACSSDSKCHHHSDGSTSCVPHDHGHDMRDSGDCGGACMGEHCHCGHGACHGTCSKRALMYRRED